MTARSIYVLACDADGCDAEFSADRRYANETRTLAQRQGWTWRGTAQPHGGPAKSVDLCERHS